MLGIIIATLVVVALVWGWHFMRTRQAAEQARWPTTQATITASEGRDDKLGGYAGNDDQDSSGAGLPSYTPYVAYRYTVDGQSYDGDMIHPFETLTQPNLAAAQAIADRYPVGSVHTVYYKPGNPKRAHLQTPVVANSTPVVASVIVAVIGAIVAVAVAMVG